MGNSVSVDRESDNEAYIRMMLLQGHTGKVLQGKASG